jgi:general secretion pathway protein G
MLRRLRNRERGFTLIELLIVVAIIGIIAAILIPNLIDALQKAKQKRTVADIRNTGTAFLSWVTDQASAAAAGQGNVWSIGSLTTQDYAWMQATLHPSSTFFYMQEVPRLDGWKYSYEFAYGGNPLAAQVIAIGSDARNGPGGTAVTQADGDIIGPFIPTDYDQDIVWSDGYFVRWPGGVQTN